MQNKIKSIRDASVFTYFLDENTYVTKNATLKPTRIAEDQFSAGYN